MDKLELKNARAEWQSRLGREPAPMDWWGKDHWLLLAYVESVTVEHAGRSE